MRVEAISKVISTIFLKIEERGTIDGEKEGRLVELVGGQNPGFEALTRSKRERERKEQRRC